MNSTRVLNHSEIATILHALRSMASNMTSGVMDSCHRLCDHFEEVGAITPEEIDELCESINCGTLAILPRAVIHSTISVLIDDIDEAIALWEHEGGRPLDAGVWPLSSPSASESPSPSTSCFICSDSSTSPRTSNLARFLKGTPMATSTPHILENHMTFGDYSQDVPVPAHSCYQCEEGLEDIDDGQVVTVGSFQPIKFGNRIAQRHTYHHFCNLNCRSKALYAATTTVSGKADLCRLVAALHLIASVEVLHRTPLARFELDEFGPAYNPSDTVAFSEFKERAMQLLAMLSPDGDENWTDEPRAAAADLAVALEISVTL